MSQSEIVQSQLCLFAATFLLFFKLNDQALDMEFLLIKVSLCKVLGHDLGDLHVPLVTLVPACQPW